MGVWFTLAFCLVLAGAWAAMWSPSGVRNRVIMLSIVLIWGRFLGQMVSTARVFRKKHRKYWYHYVIDPMTIGIVRQDRIQIKPQLFNSEKLQTPTLNNAGALPRRGPLDGISPVFCLVSNRISRIPPTWRLTPSATMRHHRGHSRSLRQTRSQTLGRVIVVTVVRHIFKMLRPRAASNASTNSSTGARDQVCSFFIR